jgi:hypothetical protein
MQLPGPVRAVVGLVALAADEAKHLPDRAIELPMLAVSSALQMSLRAQQRYARLAARGDDVLNRRPTTDEPPSWAKFDDPISVDALRAAGLDDPDPAERARAASQLLEELLGMPEGAAPMSEPPAKRAPAAKKAAAAKNPALKKTPAKKAPVRAAPAKTAPAKAAPAKAAARKSAGTQTGKSINAPRHTSPSRFDTVDE